MLIWGFFRIDLNSAVCYHRWIICTGQVFLLSWAKMSGWEVILIPDIILYIWWFYCCYWGKSRSNCDRFVNVELFMLFIFVCLLICIVLVMFLNVMSFVYSFIALKSFITVCSCPQKVACKSSDESSHESCCCCAAADVRWMRGASCFLKHVCDTPEPMVSVQIHHIHIQYMIISHLH